MLVYEVYYVDKKGNDRVVKITIEMTQEAEVDTINLINEVLKLGDVATITEIGFPEDEEDDEESGDEENEDE